MDKTTFCLKPFNHLFLGTSGDVRTCCSAKTEIGNLNTSSIEEIIDGPVAQEVRNAILNKQWHEQCIQCKNTELQGGPSERSLYLDTYKNKNKLNTSVFDKSYFKLEAIDLRWSNTCNLACNYCYPYFSSQWANIKGIKVNTLKEDNQDSLFEYLERNKDSIIDINCLGGEPLLLKQNSKLLDILPDKRYYVLTNLSVPLEKNEMARKLLANRNVSWGVSFETVGDRFEYVRHNASWNQFVKNIRYIKDRTVCSVTPHPLYCVYSAFNLDEFYDFTVNEVKSTKMYWGLSGDNSKGFNVFQLSKDLRIKAIDEIEKCQLKYSSFINMDSLVKIKESLKESLSNTRNENLKFIQWTEQLETIDLPNKSNTFKNLWPELHQNLTETDYE